MKQINSNTSGVARKLSLAPLFILLAISISALPIQTYGMEAATILFMSSLATGGIILHLLANIEKNWLRIDTVFILGFFVVHFQWPIMYAVTDLVPLYGFQKYSIEQSGSYAVSLATIAILSWVIGYAFAPTPSGKMRIDKITGEKYLILAFLAAIAGFSYFAGGSFFDRSIYTEVTEELSQTIGGIAAYFFSFVEVFAIITLSFIFYSNFVVDRKTDRSSLTITVILAALLLIYCLIFLVGGDRGQVVLLLLGAGLAFAAKVRPVRLWEFLALAALGFVLFSIIGIWRTGIGASELSVTGDFGFWQISTNLAQSIVALTQAVSIVERDGYHFGTLWLSQILGVVPFGQTIFLSYTGLTVADISSPVLITRFTLGDNPTTGLGTSFVGDIYLNLGVPGLVVLSAVYGAVCARMSIWLRGDYGFLRYLAAIAFGCLILYISRSSLLFQLKPILWGVGFSLLLLKVSRLR